MGDRILEIDIVGFKYHMNDLAAAIGLGNLEVFPKQLKKTQRIAAIYQNEFKDVPGVRLLEYKEDRESAYWLFTILVEKRNN